MKISFSLSLIVALSLLASCGGGNASSSSASQSRGDAREMPMSHARLIKISQRGSITEVEIRNPWDTATLLRSYWLVPRDSVVENIPNDISVIRTPVKKSVIFTGVHAALVNELGHGECLSGICDVDYVSDTSLKTYIKKGVITDCGNYQTPNIEKIISLDPEVILLSPYEGNSVSPKLATLGIPIVECADYMESTPLGRAEWIKFYGRLIGEGQRADSLFREVENKYQKLKESVSVAKTKPTVLFDRIYGNAWYVPEKSSTTSRFITDAGGRNPFDYLEKSGSTPLSSEEVLLKAGNADYWLIRHAGENISYKSLASDNPVYPRFKPYKDGKIYTCNTTQTGVFDQAAFHPELLLEELVAILHPEVSDSKYQNRYYFQLEK